MRVLLRIPLTQLMMHSLKMAFQLKRQKCKKLSSLICLSSWLVFILKTSISFKTKVLKSTITMSQPKKMSLFPTKLNKHWIKLGSVMGIWLHWSTSNYCSCQLAPKILRRLDPEDKFHPKQNACIIGFFISTIIQHTYNALVSTKVAPLTECELAWVLMATDSIFWGAITDCQVISIQGIVYFTFPISWVTTGLTPSPENKAPLPILHLTWPTRFERFVIETWNKYMVS